MTVTNKIVNVFLVGNNPTELGEVIRNLSSHRIRTDYDFTGRRLLRRLKEFDPACILIDDNIGTAGLRRLLHKLRSARHTRHIPVTLLKNSNFQDPGSGYISEFILKAGITPESLTKNILNLEKLERAHAYVSQRIRHSRKKLRYMMH